MKEIVNAIGSGVNIIYTDLVRMPLYNKRANKESYKNWDIEIIASGSFKISENNTIVEQSDLAYPIQIEIEIEKIKNELQCMFDINERLKLLEHNGHVFDSEPIDPTTAIRFHDTAQVVCDEDIRKLITNVMLKKIASRDVNILRSLDIIKNLSTQELVKLQKLKALIIDGAYLLFENEMATIEKDNFSEMGEIIINEFFLLPALLGDDTLRLFTDLKFKDLQEFDSLGLLSITNTFLGCNFPNLIIKENIYKINSESEEIVIHNYSLSNVLLLILESIEADYSTLDFEAYKKFLENHLNIELVSCCLFVENDLVKTID
jgi:hypothetical protein